ncbi:MAG: YlxR family protein [Clostridiales bacterium]|jgi:predicted RNA-binding protein YlxR (DUF448 family)|nr:YlxR family protein [Clostridiales bacterium]
MAERRTPQRMCIACRRTADKNTLARIVRGADGAISFDATGKKNGRGAYICFNAECVKKCVKTRALNRVFSREVDKSVYDKLTEDFNAAKG